MDAAPWLAPGASPYVGFSPDPLSPAHLLPRVREGGDLRAEVAVEDPAEAAHDEDRVAQHRPEVGAVELADALLVEARHVGVADEHDEAHREDGEDEDVEVEEDLLKVALFETCGHH